MLQYSESTKQCHTGFNVTQEELNLITPALQNPPQGIPLLNVIGNLIAYRAGLAWTTLGHTGNCRTHPPTNQIKAHKPKNKQAWISTFTPTPSLPPFPFLEW